MQGAFNARIQAKYQGSVWQSGCKSWYLGKDGRNTTLWPSFTFRFRLETARFGMADYEVRALPSPHEHVPAPLPEPALAESPRAAEVHP